MTDILRRTETDAGTVIIVMRELYWWVEIESDLLNGYNNECFANIDDASVYYNHIAKKLKVIAVINTYTTELESHAYFGSSLGVPVTHYDDVASDLMEVFNLN